MMRTCAVSLACCLMAAGAYAQDAPPAETGSTPPPAPFYEGDALGAPDQAAPGAEYDWPDEWRPYVEGAASPEPAEQTPGAFGGEDPIYVQALNVFKYMAIGLALFIFAVWLAKRLGQKTRILPGNELAEVIGRVFLAPRIALHFVRTGGKVLVIGINQNAMTPIAEFDADTFQAALTGGTNDAPAARQTAGGSAAGSGTDTDRARKFLDELRTQQTRMNGGGDSGAKTEPDDEIAALRGDIVRLQRMLREATDDPGR